jgi:hypothetical protein
MAQKEINCQGVSTRMMELLYGELSGNERATIEAHLAACSSCRAELAAFQSTRASARRALDVDEPPSRAHQAILRAAAAAVVAKQPNPIETRAAAPQSSFWERWRARWTLPTFATVGAVAVVLLASKVFLEPEKTVELGRHVLRTTPAEAPAAPPTAAEPQAPVGAEAQEERLHSAPAQKKSEKERRGAGPERLQPSAAENAPPPSTAAPATGQHRRAAPAGFGAPGGLEKGAGAASSERAKLRASDGFDIEDELAGGPPGGSRPAKREFAPPPPPLAEPARPARPAAKQSRDRDVEGEALDDAAAAPRGSVGHVAGGAGEAPPPARAKAKREDKNEETRAEMPAEMPSALPSATSNLDRNPAAPPPAPAPSRAPSAARAASVEDKAEAKSESRAESKPVAESPVARADRLFAQGQWAAAARAYRDLLRRDPHNGDAARWRQRLAASEEAASAHGPGAAPAGVP